MKKETCSIDNGCISSAKQCPSPNKNDRPNSDDISLIVIHNISLPPGQFEGDFIDDFFLNKLQPEIHPYFKDICHLEVSSHLLIRRDGSTTQYVPFHERAWHAGVSSFKGRSNCNDFSVGIELEGTDDLPYTEEQYTALAQVCRELINTYPDLCNENITGHSDIAPGRKTDPGDSFDWPKFKALLSRF